MRRATLMVLGMAAFMPWGMAETETSMEQVRVSLDTAVPAVHPKQDLVIVVSFKNGGDYPVSLEEELLSIDNIEVRHQDGRPESPAGDVEASPSGSIVVAARETYELKLNLSSRYPRLTKKRRVITVEWSAGSLAAEPLKVVIIREYDPKKDRRALIETEVGTMTWRLLPEYAPVHVKNFVELARQGHYDGLTIFRAVPGLKIEGGDPGGDGTGAWEELLMPEFSASVPPIAGIVGASRQETSMTSNSMFFILLAPTALMQGKQTFFALLEDGWDTISHVLARPRKGDTRMGDAYLLHEPVKILSVTIK